MTTATAALAPLLLEDFARHLAERPGSGPLFGRHHIGPCMARVTALALEETRTVRQRQQRRRPQCLLLHARLGAGAACAVCVFCPSL